ncbi:MAG: hypothetical protein WDZ93_02145 [Candidatus Paceibacterota bacterium]
MIFAASFPTLLGLLFFTLLFLFTIYSCMLGYHWFTYGTSVHKSRLSLSIYLAGAGILFLIMGIILYTLSIVPYAY